MSEQIFHEHVSKNPDIGVRFYRSKMSEPGIVPFHWHLSLEIIYLINGELTFTINNNTFTIYGNEFMVVPSGAIHMVTHKPNEAFVLQTPIEYIEPYWSHPDQTIFSIDKSKKQYTDIAKSFSILDSIYHNKFGGYRFEFHAVLLDILAILFENFSLENTSETITTSKTKEILSYINDHSHENITVSSIADYFSYHPNYLGRLFKKEIGITPLQYIYQIRMRDFHHNVITTDTPINDLMRNHKLTNKHLVFKYFKMDYGASPLQLRKKFKN